MKKLLVIIILLGQYLIANSDYDKDIIVHDQSRDAKVKVVFNELIQYYEEEDLHEFFELISEERFVQDYITFFEAVDNDFEKYEINDFDSWIDKITSDGVKRYLYVQWEKRYESNEGGSERLQKGYSRFLFDEINGEYKLIELAGNNLWGGSLPEWREEVFSISGQERAVVPIVSEPEITEPEQEPVITEPESEPEVTEPEPEPEPEPVTLADLQVSGLICPDATYEAEFNIINSGGTDTTEGQINYTVDTIYETGSEHSEEHTYDGDISAGGSVSVSHDVNCEFSIRVTLDPDDYIEEESESNNVSTIQ